MRIAVLGAVAFTDRCLTALALEHADFLAGVVTLPQNARRQLHSDAGDARNALRRAGCDAPVLEIEDLNCAAGLAAIQDLSPDHLFVLGWSRLLGPDILAAIPGHVVGSHPAPLPKGRGRHPIIWPLALGWKRSALTLFSIDNGPPDSGPILWQEPFGIGPDDTATEVYETVCALGERAMRELPAVLAAGTCAGRAQDHAASTEFPRRSAADGLLDWTRPARELRNLIRALNRPYPGADGELAGFGAFKAWRCELASPHDLDTPSTPGRPDMPDWPGAWREENGTIVVRTGDGGVRITEFERTGS